MVMNGDLLLHNTLWDSAHLDAQRTGRGGMDFRPMLSDLRPLVGSADLAICHLETPLAPRGGPYSSYPVFSVPPQIVPAIKATGYDACTTVSNHSLDAGFDGIVRTLRDFDRAGIEHAGTVTTKHASRQPLLLDVRGVKVGLVAATYGTNGIPLPADEPWSVPIINVDKIEAMARRARQRGADIVLVGLHWGDEYVHTPSAYQVDIAEQLSQDKDISLIYGEHAHVVQPITRVNGTWVVYGLGNGVAAQSTDVEGVYDGLAVRVTFTGVPGGRFTVSRLQWVPTMITQFDGTHPVRVLDVPRALHETHYAALRSQLLATQARVRADVNLLGALKHGVTEGR
jgi:poly-gamma-glutamate capsule biosynthesis protein CapA/YwtB (metallophosphatase superfamily)